MTCGKIRLAPILILLGGLVVPAFSDTITNAERDLVLDESVRRALSDNTVLVAMRARLAGMKAARRIEGALPNPMVTVSAEGPTGSGLEDRAVELEQSLPGIGKLHLKRKIAEDAVSIMQYDYEAMLRDIKMAVQMNYFDLRAVQHSIPLLQKELGVVSNLVQSATARYAAGLAQQQDVLKAQTELSMLRQRIIESLQKEITLKTRLNILMNRSPELPLGTAVTAPAANVITNLDVLISLAKTTSPDILAARARLEQAKKAKRLSAFEYSPDLMIGARYGSMGDERNLMLMLGIDLPIWVRKNKAMLDEARQNVAAQSADSEGAEKELLQELVDAHGGMFTSLAMLKLYREEMIPQSEQRYAASESGYSAGKVDFMDVLESERFLLNAKMMALMEEANLGTQLGRIECCVGYNLRPATDVKGGESK